ncbi:MAG: hypothetical protein GEV07_00025 [Streptosporangiales bacterium]|nr:hypothetical protein [Streptosporangiales bacterium]
MSTDAGTLYRRFLLDLWHAGDDDLPGLAAELVGPEFTIHRRGTSGPTTGPDAAVELITGGRAYFDDVEVTLDLGPIVDGQYVAGRWTFAGSYLGGIPGASAAVGTRVAFSGHDIVHVADERITDYWGSSDADHLMEQLTAG